MKRSFIFALLLAAGLLALLFLKAGGDPAGDVADGGVGAREGVV